MSSVQNIEIDKGAYEEVQFTWLDSSTNLPKDTTDYTGVLKARRTVGDDTVLLEFTTENNKITIDDEGNISVFFSASDTANADWNSAFYELAFTNPDGNVISFLKGKIVLSEKII